MMMMVDGILKRIVMEVMEVMDVWDVGNPSAHVRETLT